MRYVIDPLISALQKGESAVLAAIITISGSAPRSSGARMLVHEDTSLAGTIGGGVVEGACLRAAKELLIDSANHAELQFDLSAEDAADAGMVCGGSVGVLLQKVEPGQLLLFTSLRSSFKRRLRPVLLTSLPGKDKEPAFYLLGAEMDNTVEEELQQKVLAKPRRTSFILSHKGVDYFVEPLVHPGTVHIAGAGHVGLATAHLAASAGFDVVVMDDRAEFASEERYPWATGVRVLDGFDSCFNGLGMDDYVVIVTRGHIHDRDVLGQALGTGAGYIGMIGSSQKRRATYQALLQDGFTELDLQRVHSPIGLAIGAESPEEIGFSIVAELIKERSERIC